jgi:hypothetical protein
VADKPHDLPTMPGTVQVPGGDTLDDSGSTLPLFATVVPVTNPSDAMAPLLAAPTLPAAWRYQMRAEIARGGMGRVVEADDGVLGRVVALKEALSRDPDSLRRFERETRITARLEHPSIVPVHDAGVSPSGAPFYVMRKISGRPLEELVATRGALEQRLELLPNIVAAAHAIAHAHERGVVHRDIKPANILVGDLGETIVIDWGLAKTIGETDDAHGHHVHPSAAHSIIDDNIVKTRAGIVYGTPGFMSPEQLRGRPIDETSDVYALGATLYYLLGRRPPHYAATGDAMMQAAVAGPAVPIRDMEPGVPRELATIVDKALAHDSSKRYRDARSLAEDLQRFLTGQLVASHHYSPRERIVRFVRRNRAAVAVSGAATFAMIIGAWLAISRIVDARDRAAENAQAAQAAQQKAETERERATRSFNQLSVVDAREKTKLDATRAVAMIKPLAGTPTAWRAARAIGAAARANGVAFGLPASPHTQSLELSRDGKRALSSGSDGVVRLYDLARRDTREVWKASGAANARFADAGRAIIVASGDVLVIVDPASTRTRTIKVGSPIESLATSGPIAYWIGAHQTLWRVDIASAAATPTQVAVDEPIASIAPSPDGRWIAVASPTHLLLLDRTQPTLPPQELATGATHTLAWSADSARVAALLDDDALVFELPSATLMHRQNVGTRYQLAFAGDQLYTTGASGLAQIAREDPHARHVDGEFELGVLATSHGVIAGSAEGVLAEISLEGERVLHAPAGARLHAIASASDTPWLLAASDGVIFAWDLDALEPKRLTPPPSAAQFVTSDAIIATYQDAPARWIDLRDDKVVALPPLAGLRAVVAAPDGTHALVIDGEHHAVIVGPDASARELTGDVAFGAYLDDRRIVVAGGDGTLRIEQADSSTLLASALGPVIALSTRDGSVAAAHARILWRRRRGSSRDETLDVQDAPVTLELARGDDAIFAVDQVLRAWRADGTVVTLASFDKPIERAKVIEPEATRAIVITNDGAARICELGQPMPVTRPLVTAGHASIADVGRLVTVTPEGVLAIVEPDIADTWTLAEPRGRTFSFAQISRDGRRVLAQTPTGVSIWRLDLPESAADTARWLEAMTNATLDRDDLSTALTWR